MGSARPRTVTSGVPVRVWFVFFWVIWKPGGLSNCQNCGGRWPGALPRARAVCGVAGKSSRICDADRTHLQAGSQSGRCCELNQSTHSIHIFLQITEIDARHVQPIISINFRSSTEIFTFTLIKFGKCT